LFRKWCAELSRVMSDGRGGYIEGQKMLKEFRKVVEAWSGDLDEFVVHRSRSINVSNVPFVGKVLTFFGLEKIPIRDPFFVGRKPYLLFLNDLYRPQQNSLVGRSNRFDSDNDQKLLQFLLAEDSLPDRRGLAHGSTIEDSSLSPAHSKAHQHGALGSNPTHPFPINQNRDPQKGQKTYLPPMYRSLEQLVLSHLSPQELAELPIPKDSVRTEAYLNAILGYALDNLLLCGETVAKLIEQNFQLSAPFILDMRHNGTLWLDKEGHIVCILDAAILYSEHNDRWYIHSAETYTVLTGRLIDQTFTTAERPLILAAPHYQAGVITRWSKASS
jgi:hypothetical protein